MERCRVTDVEESGDVVVNGSMTLRADAGWGELRRQSPDTEPTTPSWVSLSWSVEQALWRHWDDLIAEECAGCGSEEARQIIEPILREALESKDD